MTRTPKLPSILDALPFWSSLALIPLVLIGAVNGGWTVVLVPLATWWLFSGLDALIGRSRANIDPETPDDSLFWYKTITRVWPAIQVALLIWVLWYVPGAPHLVLWEKFAVFFGVGVVSGTIGINYSHELMHQRSKLDRWLADVLLATVFYSHFRSEHLLVHHLYVGTPKDAVTARYNEGFHRFFARVLPGCFLSAFWAEGRMQVRKGNSAWDLSNPFWRYAALQALVLVIAVLLAGWLGLALVLWQGLVAVWQLELVNYVEHYGLVRQHLGDGKYEPVKPRHSWNANHRASNWLLINLQRHSDHHFHPARPFPLLQSGDREETPELPFGYPVMTTFAMIPPVWRRVMNPRVRAWRRKFYPDISDWTGTGRLMPR